MKKSLEAHEERALRKKGTKGKAIHCGLGLAHNPRLDGVPVCVPTVAPDDVELLKRLSESKKLDRQVGSSGDRRTQSA